MSIALSLRHVSKTYSTGGRTFKALDNVDLDIEEGKLVVILGPSGAGKSTLLNLIGGMDSPSEGTIMAGGTDISRYSENELADYRAANVGFIFQFYNILPTLTVLENVNLVADLAGGAPGQIPESALRRRAAESLDRPRDHQEPDDAAVRRTNRGAGFRNRRDDPQAPERTDSARQDSHHRHTQLPVRRRGGRGRPAQERQDPERVGCGRSEEHRRRRVVRRGRACSGKNYTEIFA